MQEDCNGKPIESYTDEQVNMALRACQEHDRSAAEGNLRLITTSIPRDPKERLALLKFIAENHNAASWEEFLEETDETHDETHVGEGEVDDNVSKVVHYLYTHFVQNKINAEEPLRVSNPLVPTLKPIGPNSRTHWSQLSDPLVVPQSLPACPRRMPKLISLTTSSRACTKMTTGTQSTFPKLITMRQCTAMASPVLLLERSLRR